MKDIQFNSIQFLVLNFSAPWIIFCPLSNAHKFRGYNNFWNWTFISGRGAREQIKVKFQTLLYPINLCAFERGQNMLQGALKIRTKTQNVSPSAAWENLWLRAIFANCAKTTCQIVSILTDKIILWTNKHFPKRKLFNFCQERQCRQVNNI